MMMMMIMMMMMMVMMMTMTTTTTIMMMMVVVVVMTTMIMMKQKKKKEKNSNNNMNTSSINNNDDEARSKNKKTKLDTRKGISVQCALSRKVLMTVTSFLSAGYHSAQTDHPLLCGTMSQRPNVPHRTHASVRNICDPPPQNES